MIATQASVHPVPVRWGRTCSTGAILRKRDEKILKLTRELGAYKSGEKHAKEAKK